MLKQWQQNSMQGIVGIWLVRECMQKGCAKSMPNNRYNELRIMAADERK